MDAGNEEQLFCVKNDGLSRPSYSSVQRTCWYEAHGLQSDIQKIARLLKKIPDRTFLFYSVNIFADIAFYRRHFIIRNSVVNICRFIYFQEVNRIHAYCCAIGAEDVLEKLIQVLHEESSSQSPLIVKHAMYTSEKLR